MDKDLIKKWLDGTLNEEEESAFLNSDDFQRIKRIMENSKSFKAPEYDVEAELKRFTEDHFTPVRKLSWPKVAYRVAAAVAVIALVWFLYPKESAKEYYTTTGEKIELYLPDSSLVHLNASSFLSINKSNWSDKREVKLQGEAFFKVRKGSDFTVVTNEGTVTVLGTEFNVKSRNNFYEVICYEGLVRVDSEQNHVELSANDLFRITNTSVYEDKYKLNSPSWITDESSFVSVPLAEVLNEFERQYGIELTYENIAMDQLYTGSFTHKDLTLALQAVTLPMNIKFEIIDDQTIVLTGELE